MKKNKPILLKFASRSRPAKCIDGIRNILSTAWDKSQVVIVVSADLDDETMYCQSFLREIEAEIKSGHVIICYGESKSKIDAINRDFDIIGRRFNWNILINFSDDMRWTTEGWDLNIIGGFARHFPDFNGNLHFNDGFTGARISTMSIIGREYYKLFNYVYHPSYKSLFCDNEYTEVAYAAGKMKYFQTQLFSHEHPSNIGGNHDELLRKTESFWAMDKSNYEIRKKAGFPC